MIIIGRGQVEEDRLEVPVRHQRHAQEPAQGVQGRMRPRSACVEPYSKCPFSNHQSQQQIQILGYHISVDTVIRDKIFNTQNNEFFN